MRKVVIVLIMVFISISSAFADQVVLDYSTSDGLGLAADGTVIETISAKNSGTLVSWWSGEGSVGSATSSTWRQVIKWDLSEMQAVQDNLQPGELIQYNSIRMRFTAKHLSSWSQYVEAHYLTSLSTHGEMTWANSSSASTWTTPGGDFIGDVIPGSYIYPSGSYATRDVSLDLTVIDQWLANGNAGILFMGREDTSTENRCKMLLSNVSSIYDSFDVIPAGATVSNYTRPLLLVDYEVVPEPVTMGLVALGSLLGVIRKRK